jgi:hypothetical protein
VLETRSDALDNSLPAFDYLRQGGRCFRARGQGFVVAIGGSSCCGGTSEGDFGKKKGVLLLAEHAKALGS